MNEEEKKYIGYYDKGGQYIPPDESSQSVLPLALLQSVNTLVTLEDDLLESQLKAFDSILPTLTEEAQSQFTSLLGTLAIHAATINIRLRLRKAFMSLCAGEPICKP